MCNYKCANSLRAYTDKRGQDQCWRQQPEKTVLHWKRLVSSLAIRGTVDANPDKINRLESGSLILSGALYGPYRSAVINLDVPQPATEAAFNRVTTWIARFLEDPERYPVLPAVAPGDIANRLPESPPREGESLDDILDDFEQVIVPGITHWNHPGFFAYFANTGSVPGVLAEMLTAALNVNAMLWKTSPAATELEERALDWLQIGRAHV